MSAQTDMRYHVHCTVCGTKLGGYLTQEDANAAALDSGWECVHRDRFWCPRCAIRGIPTDRRAIQEKYGLNETEMVDLLSCDPDAVERVRHLVASRPYVQLAVEDLAALRDEVRP